MGRRIPDEVINQVRRHFDIVDVVGKYVQLKKSGRNYFGLCPFHSEKTPSFSVAADKQIYHCFGCGAGGDSIKFVMDVEHLTFLEVVERLAEEAGISLPNEVRELTPEEMERATLYKILDLSAKLYHHVLMNTPQGNDGKAYLARRRVNPETAQAFQLGFAPRSYDFLLSFLTKRGYATSLIEKAGLIKKNDSQGTYRDRFYGRLMFPIHDSKGRVIAFGARSFEESEQAKYLNSPETGLFHKRKQLYNLYRAKSSIRKEQNIVLAEGYMDVIMMWQEGVHTGVATLGTALSEDQVNVIKQHTKSVIICYDSDNAGQNAALKALELMRPHELMVKVAPLPIGFDPDDYIRRFGGNSFQKEMIAGAVSSISFQLERAKKDFRLQDEVERLTYIRKAVEMISDLPIAIEQDHYLRKLAEEFQISMEALKEEQRHIRFRKKKQAWGDKEAGKWNNGYKEDSRMVSRKLRSYHPIERAEMHLLAHMMRDRSVCDWVQDHLGADFQTEVHTALVAHLYSYYAEGHPAELGQFLHSLKEPSFIHKATEIAMMDVPEEVSEEALKDYINQVKQVPLEREWNKNQKLVKQIERAGEPMKAAQLGLELIEQLRQKKKMR
ncbi:DNA primase [Croceifilum oryzae]|uniref:DNA primase n=1 Tax=Croceifilum oryzae TaxID=1553429 RepID=A0AAJ1THF8_9BACL|nr:DNA primase [Croceifilum oryzae]MDQ0416271.1 DNA primase [Croceifilum oryzae]